MLLNCALSHSCKCSDYLQHPYFLTWIGLGLTAVLADRQKSDGFMRHGCDTILEVRVCWYRIQNQTSFCLFSQINSWNTDSRKYTNNWLNYDSDVPLWICATLSLLQGYLTLSDLSKNDTNASTTYNNMHTTCTIDVWVSLRSSPCGLSYVQKSQKIFRSQKKFHSQVTFFTSSWRIPTLSDIHDCMDLSPLQWLPKCTPERQPKAAPCRPKMCVPRLLKKINTRQQDGFKSRNSKQGCSVQVLATADPGTC